MTNSRSFDLGERRALIVMDNIGEPRGAARCHRPRLREDHRTFFRHRADPVASKSGSRAELQYQNRLADTAFARQQARLTQRNPIPNRPQARRWRDLIPVSHVEKFDLILGLRIGLRILIFSIELALRAVEVVTRVIRLLRASAAMWKIVPAPMLIGGQVRSAFHFVHVPSGSYLPDLRDHASNAANAIGEPLVARNAAIATRFQTSQFTSLFGMFASADAIKRGSASRSLSVLSASAKRSKLFSDLLPDRPLSRVARLH